MATSPVYAQALGSEEGPHVTKPSGIVSEAPVMICSTFEAMNASRRNTMEDVHVVCAPGTWGAPDKDMAYLAVYDGHGGENEKCVFCRKKGFLLDAMLTLWLSHEHIIHHQRPRHRRLS
jgi:hypothetical protein